MKRNLLLLIVICFSTIATAQNFTGGFNFNLPWNDSTTQQFLPQFPINKIVDGKFVSADANGNFVLDGKQIRFWGGNCVASGAFPSKEVVAGVAGRMRKMGINLIRFHHIDNDWGGPSLLTGSDTRVLNPTYLDLMENFIARMKENGIFINMNLNVSRMFKPFDGVTYADSVKNYGTDYFKVITYFDPYLIMLQKEYAQQLLTHVNPYTGKALVNDPVMAMLETNNENSLYRGWKENILKPIKSGGKLIYIHARMLDSLWNDFLSKKYSSTANLKTAWNSGSVLPGQGEQIINGGFEKNNLRTNWVLEKNSSGADADTSRDNSTSYKGSYSVKVVVKSATGTEWHIQFKQPTLTFKKDSLYTVSFAAKAESSHQINVSTMNDQSPWNGYGGKNFLISTSWNVYTFSFKASETNNGHARITFQLGKEKGTFWFDEVSLTKASLNGLLADEQLEQRNVRRIDYADCVSYSDQRVKDISEFYIKLQQDYYKDMFAYLKNTLGVKVPIVGTNWNLGAGDLAAQSVGDYVDNHSYWDHPSFPNIPWSSTDWLISNKPMVKDANGGTIPGLFAGVPMAYKPYTVSEYNHPFPNQHQAEAVNFILGYSAFNGADGVMLFDYGSSSNWVDDKVDSYFSINRNPIFMAQFPAAAYAFRNGLIAESSSPKNVNYKSETIYLMPKNDSNSWGSSVLFEKKFSLINSIRTESYSGSSETDFASMQTAPVSPYKTDNGQLTWDVANGVYSIVSSSFQSVTGFFNNLAGKRIGDIYFYPTDKEYFGSLSYLRLDKDRDLITLVSKVQNTNMIWSGTTSINNHWGSKPTQIYPLKLKLDLAITADSIRVYPLDNIGRESELSAKTYKPFALYHFMVDFDQSVYGTLWYGIKKYVNGVLPGVEDEETIPTKTELMQNYPNPFNPETTISYKLQAASKVSLKVYDVLGREVVTLVNEYKQAGAYNEKFNVKTRHGASLQSGIYFYRLQAGSFYEIKKMMLLK
ncbi:MAG: Carbohydrate-binding CenC domain protein [Stygiobacter sp.]|nr:MAG: Carbohydrate-binding CenC domain protein [Stygiobacter sp.]